MMTASVQDDNPQPDVLLIMKSAGNRKAMAQMLAEQHFSSIALTEERALQQVIEDRAITLALVDVAGLGPTVWQMCAQLQAAKIPFIVLSTPQALAASSNALAYGARSVLQKPIAKAALLQLLGSLANTDR